MFLLTERRTQYLTQKIRIQPMRASKGENVLYLRIKK